MADNNTAAAAAESVGNKPQKRRRKLGDRYDGRRVRSLPPMQYVTAFIMKERNDASNYFRGKIDMTPINEYIRRKTQEEELVGFGFMHVIVTAYLRVVATHPGLNRFIAGQRIYQRGDVVLSMMVKKGFGLNSQGTAIKPVFSSKESVYEVYEKMQAEIENARKEGDSTNLDSVARAITHLPTLLLRGFIDLMRFLDYFGVMPKAINRASPFHSSIFISNLGSVGIPPIYHHLYNFGNVPVFITFGHMYKENVLNRDGSVSLRRFIDYTVVTDERITDGQYYADAMKQLSRLLANPKSLDMPADTVIEDVD